MSTQEQAQDQSGVWQRQGDVDRLFGPEGGVVVWFRRDEVSARAAVRGEGDPFQTATDFAMVTIALERCIHGMAERLGVPIETMIGMMASAHDVIVNEMKIEHAVRIMAGGTRPERRDDAGSEGAD